MALISEEDWRDILDDIQDQKAVLLVGPESIQPDGQPLSLHLRNALHQSNPEDIAYYYERDGFFLFSSPEGKVRVARQVKRFYRNLVPDEKTLRHITAIPFHVIVSLNPDTFISEAFYRYGIKHRFHYFQYRHANSGDGEIEKPHKSIPLIYNLFGSKDRDESLLLDYDDVYKMLQSTLGTSSLPSGLLRTLREASTYVFIGFQFDKWYSQLLFKFLSDNGRIEKRISNDSPLTDLDTNGFILHQFQIRFMGKQTNFLEQLYQRCATKEILRDLAEETVNSNGIVIRRFLAMGEITNAIDSLSRLVKDSEAENEVTLLQSRHNTIENGRDRMDSRDYRTEIAQIIDGLLELTQRICI